MKAKKANEGRARAAARRTLEQQGISEPPVDPVAIAESSGITVRSSKKLGTSFSGCLLRNGQTFGILYSTSIPNRGFQRFTVGHELGHYVLGHHEELLGDGTPHFSASGFTSTQWYEREADFFSSELLIPDFLFEKCRRGLPVGLNAVKAIAERFDTSLTAAGFRYAALSPDPVAVIMSEGDRVICCFPSGPLEKLPGVRFGLRKGDPLPNSTTKSFNAKRENVASSAERDGATSLCDWFDDTRHEISLVEEVIGLGSYGRTLTVLSTECVPDPDEEEEPEHDPDYFRPDGRRWRY